MKITNAKTFANKIIANFIILSMQANIFDIPGGERFRTLTSHYYKHTDVAILMHAVNDQGSLEHLYDEADDARKLIETESCMLVVVGNKADLPPEIEEASVKVLSKVLRAKFYFYTSAKTGQNIMESMNFIVQNLHRSQTSSAKPYLGDHHAIKITLTDGQSRDRSESQRLSSFSAFTVSGHGRTKVHIMYTI